MTERIWVGFLALLCMVFGLAKLLRPLFFLQLRKRHPWFNAVDIYSFIYKSAYAEHAIRVNGGLLVIIGLGLAAWVFLG